MQSSQRIVVNTLAQYIRTIINMVLSLYSSRLVLNILGVDDYGVYSLVAGVVSMLSFLTNSLVGSTQRFLSVSQGKGNMERLKEVFNNSLILHIALGFIVAIILFALTPFIFDGFLNIPNGSVEVAKELYILVVLMVYISFIASPYRALLVSHENIVYTSIIDVLDGILKVGLVLLLPYIPINKLLAYGLIMLSIQSFNLIAFMVYSHLKYDECSWPKLRLFSLSYVKELSKFTGWVVYSSVCITLRNQGLAIVLNKIYGTAINAAYGIGMQISGMVSFISSSFQNAIAPQLMAAEGAGDRNRMLALAEIQSKASFLLLAMIGIPVMFEMPTLLKLWLVNVPDYTVLFARTFLSMQIVDMLSTGLAAANRAIGNIGRYTVLTYTPKLLIMPIGWLGLKCGISLLTIALIMVAIEALCMYLRIHLYRKEGWFNAMDFFKSVILRTMPPVLVSVGSCVICNMLISSRIACFVGSFLFSIPIFLTLSYYISLNTHEKVFVKKIVNKVLRRKYDEA